MYFIDNYLIYLLILLYKYNLKVKKVSKDSLMAVKGEVDWSKSGKSELSVVNSGVANMRTEDVISHGLL
jgi:hypothetical protein